MKDQMDLFGPAPRVTAPKEPKSSARKSPTTLKPFAAPSMKQAAESAKRLGIKLGGRFADQPVKTCASCTAPCYLGRDPSSQVDVWAWLHDAEGNVWAVEDRVGEFAPALCNRCRTRAASAGGA